MSYHVMSGCGMDRRLRDGGLHVHAHGMGSGDGAFNYRKFDERKQWLLQ